MILKNGTASRVTMGNGAGIYRELDQPCDQPEFSNRQASPNPELPPAKQLC